MLRGPLASLSLYPFALALLPALALPYAWVQVHSVDQKGMVAACLLGFALVTSAIALLRKAPWPTVRFPPVAYAAVALAGVGVLSALLNGLSVTKFFGVGFGVGTGGSLILFAAAVVLGALMNREQVRRHYLLYLYTVLTLVFLAVVVSLFGTEALNIIPVTWPESSFLLVLGLIIAVVMGEEEKSARRVCVGTSIVLTAALLILFQSFAVWLGCALLILFILWRMLTLRKIPGIPWLAVSIALFLATLLASGYESPLSLPQDIRPGAGVTIAAAELNYTQSVRGAFVGSGPDTFTSLWEQRRSPELNSVFSESGDVNSISSIAFKEGYSTALTWVATLGFLGIACYILCFLLLVWGAGRALLQKHPTALGDPVFVLATLVALFGFVVSVFYPIDLTLFLLSGAAFGFSAGLLAKSKSSSSPRSSTRPVFAILLLIIGGAFVALPSAQFAAGVLYARGTQDYTAGEYLRAENLSGRAASLWPLSIYLQQAVYTSIKALHVRAEWYMSERSQELDIERVRSLARAAVAQDRGDYSAWLAEGSAFAALLDTRSTDPGAEARQALTQAELLAPTRPEIFVSHASLSYMLGDWAEVETYLDKAFALDPHNQFAQELQLQLQNLKPSLQ